MVLHCLQILRVGDVLFLHLKVVLAPVIPFIVIALVQDPQPAKQTQRLLVTPLRKRFVIFLLVSRYCSQCSVLSLNIVTIRLSYFKLFDFINQVTICKLLSNDKSNQLD